jgi:hypothetical protein
VVSPVPLALTRTTYGLFLHAASEPRGTGKGYAITLDSDRLSDELNDDELDLVSAGGSTSGPFQMKLSG